MATAGDLFGGFPRIAPCGGHVRQRAGPPLATYTSVLIANSAIPVWHEARRELPFVFAASAASSAGAAAPIITPSRHSAPAQRLAVAGAAIEAVANEAMEAPARAGLPRPTAAALPAATGGRPGASL